MLQRSSGAATIDVLTPPIIQIGSISDTPNFGLFICKPLQHRCHHYFHLRIHRNRLAAGLCSDSLGELTALPKPWLQEVGRPRKGKERMERNGEREEGVEEGSGGKE